MNTTTLVYGQEKKVVEAADGAPFSEIIAAANLPLEQPCAGRGTCGSCKVLVEQGGNPPDEIEHQHLTAGELAVGTRLACRARVQGDTQIVLSPIVVYSNKVFKGSKRHRQEREVPLGLAIDLGSTTVAAYLTMLDNGEIVAGGASLNQQRIYGADIISRLHAAQNSEDHRQRLYRLAVSSINQAIGSLKLSPKIMRRVQRVTVVGNVAMHHLFAQLPIDSIATLPFQPFTSQAIRNANGLLSDILPAAVQVMLPPVIGGFVGSDALACLAAFDYDNPPGPQLAVDLGTNGEVLLTDGKTILVASTAAGPAFEGVNISCGMRAVDGAIVDADLRDGIFDFETIGDEAPQGLTGSGLIRVVYELVHAGVIDPSGRLVAYPPLMSAQLVKDNGPKTLYLTPERDVWLTQKDIRELQKAKGAIRAAIAVLMKNLGLAPADLQRVILTGSFGGQLDIEAVIGLGMIPDVPPEKVQSIPNGAGMGAAIFLSEAGFALGEKLAREARQIDLDRDADFNRIFIEALAFKAG
ncbi:MAG TPA: hypothetical protein DEH25_13250 [Chloroflexi bacterium]|nr:hypothetical protein [Chloroflexota bacterium]